MAVNFFKKIIFHKVYAHCTVNSFSWRQHWRHLHCPMQANQVMSTHEVHSTQHWCWQPHGHGLFSFSSVFKAKFYKFKLFWNQQIISMICKVKRKLSLITDNLVTFSVLFCLFLIVIMWFKICITFHIVGCENFCRNNLVGMIVYLCGVWWMIF